MAKTITLNVGHTYALSTASGCTVTDADGAQVTAVAAGTQGFSILRLQKSPYRTKTRRLSLLLMPPLSLQDPAGASALRLTRTQRKAAKTRFRAGVYTALRELPAPVPEPLGTTTLLHGHVYTLAVAADTNLSALAVAQYATCELWIDYTAGSVTWPTGLWWAEGSAPTLEAGKSYAVTLRNDGVKLRANVQYEDDTPAQS